VSSNCCLLLAIIRDGSHISALLHTNHHPNEMTKISYVSLLFQRAGWLEENKFGMLVISIIYNLRM
jgi:hypothetical protein